MSESSQVRTHDAQSAASLGQARKPYVTPTLVRYGQVAALTQNASCAGSNDSATTFSCDPTTLRQMNAASDRRLKTNIVRVGEHPLGFGLYLFDYKPEFTAEWGQGRQFGVMADEVETVVPAAVSVHEAGYKVVSYGALGITRAQHH